MNRRSVYVAINSPSGSSAILGVGDNPLIKAEPTSISAIVESERELRFRGSIVVTIEGHELAEILSIDGKCTPAYIARDSEEAAALAALDTKRVLTMLVWAIRQARNSENEDDALISLDRSTCRWVQLSL